MNVYPFIEAERAGGRNVKRACTLLKVSRAAFYAHRSGPSCREQEDAELAGRIREVHEESQGRYGAPRIHAELARRGRRYGPKRIARLMRSACAPSWVSAALANALAARDPDPGVISTATGAASTPPTSSPPSRPAAASRCPWAAPANAETTPFPSRFSLGAKAS